MSAFAFGAVRAKGNEALDLDTIRKHVPSLFADAPHASRSERYVHIPSTDVMTALMSEGFMPFAASQSRARDVTKRDFTKHMVRFRKLGDVSARQVGDVSYEVIMRNAHDGSGAYEFLAGLFRLICLNGMTVNDSTVASVHVRHSGNREKIIGQVIDGAYTVLGQSDKVLAAPRVWSGIHLSRDEQMALAESAHVVRFGDHEGNVKTAIKPAQLLEARRSADTGTDLWTTYNRVQENTIRGGITAWGRDANNRPRRTTTREVRGIDQDVKLNKALWALAEKMAELKGVSLAA